METFKIEFSYLNLKIMKKIHTILLIFSFLIFSCKNDKLKIENSTNQIEEVSKTEVKTTQNDCPNHILKNKVNNLNISILLDLSDRIDNKKYPNQSMPYFKRDLGYIKTISNSFVEHVSKKKLIMMSDKIQIYFEPEPLDATINEKAKILKTYFDKNLKSESIKNFQKNYETIPQEIYSLAQKDANYIGSDIWRFFKDKAKRYCLNDCSRNILIILTDGYMYHKDSKFKENNLTSYITPEYLRNSKLSTSGWKEKIQNDKFGYIPASFDLKDLEVLVLGIVNHDNEKNPFGRDVIEQYWSDWFVSMGIKKYEILGAELPSNLESSISKFILNK